jgi:hypothetical protein
MKKVFLLISLIALFLVLPQITHADIGIGMGPSRFSIHVDTGKTFTADVVGFNPGDYDVRARINVVCKTCTYNYTFFGWKIGEVKEDYSQFFSFSPDDIYIPNHTNTESGIHINMLITPSIWLRKTLMIPTPESLNYLIRGIDSNYQGNIEIPYYSVLTDTKTVTAQISMQAYWSTFGSMGAAPAVGVPLNMSITGMPLGSLYILIAIILICILGAVYLAFRKGVHHTLMRMIQKRKSKGLSSELPS